ncbi:MAG: hypothetical protein JXR48_17690 [Candidatus Delongbacteria bacterium]|nr:hypothetical protein [Candidatus Delongbacteria bacterium]MBN2836791.1 hypothetical protein [Candidatus Delongbacteria bacterium]
MKYLLIFLVFCSMLVSEELNLFRQNTYSFGETTYVKYNFTFPKASDFLYSSSRQGPFSLVKTNNENFYILFDPENFQGVVAGETYEASFEFTQKNIGRKKYLKVNAVYAPEFYFETSSKMTHTLNLTTGYSRASFTIIALRSLADPLYIEKNENTIITNQNGNSILIGNNEFQVSMEIEANYKDIIKFYNKKDGELLLTLNLVSSGFSNKLGDIEQKEMIESSEVIKDKEEDTVDSNFSATINDVEVKEEPIETEKIENPPVQVENTKESSKLFYWIIISISVLINLVLIIKMLIPQKAANSDKFEAFYEKCAEVLDIETKGKSIDGSMAEMMMKIVRSSKNKPANAPEKPKSQEKETVAKKESIDLDLDTGSSDKKTQSFELDINEEDIIDIDKQVEELIRQSKEKNS